MFDLPLKIGQQISFLIYKFKLLTFDFLFVHILSKP